MVVRVFFEDLADECLGACGAQCLEQQVYSDDCQFFRAARAVRTLPLGPFGLDVSVD